MSQQSEYNKIMNLTIKDLILMYQGMDKIMTLGNQTVRLRVTHEGVYVTRNIEVLE